MADDQLVSLAEETPIVVVGRRLDTTKCDTVNTDDEVGAALVVDHLVEFGHCAIAHIDGGIGAGAAERRIGYEAAMRRHGLDEYIQIVEGDFAERSGYEAADLLLCSGQRPTAIFAGNDLSATGALDRIEVAGPRLPDDISLVGFDNTALAALHHIALSTVNQPRNVLGRLAVTSLLERLDHGRSPGVHHLLAPSLVPRRTSGPVPNR
jgi:DNA-binding LacI/PurR family transcriptional regulator